MKLPWFSSAKSSKKNNELVEISEKEKTKKTYELSSLPENLQRIVILIQFAEKERIHLQKQLDVTTTAKKQLEQQLFKELNEIKK